MSETKDLGRLYATRVPYLDREGPLSESGWTVETEYPYRQGKCRAFRLPGTRFGFALGLWGPPGDEEENLIKGSGARILGPAIIDEDWDI